MAKMGRPTKYSKALASLVCEQIALGYSLRTVCKSDEMPGIATVFTWLRENIDFQEQYMRACEERTEAMSEDILDIADDAEDVQKARLQVETRKWLMAKMKPKKYGDKMAVDNTVTLVQPILGGKSIEAGK